MAEVIENNPCKWYEGYGGHSNNMYSKSWRKNHRPEGGTRWNNPQFNAYICVTEVSRDYNYMASRVTSSLYELDKAQRELIHGSVISHSKCIDEELLNLVGQDILNDLSDVIDRLKTRKDELRQLAKDHDNA